MKLSKALDVFYDQPWWVVILTDVLLLLRFPLRDAACIHGAIVVAVWFSLGRTDRLRNRMDRIERALYVDREQ